MIKIANVYQVEAINNLPAELVQAILENVTILDNEYGEEREVDHGDGGYVVVIESVDELAKLKDVHLDVNTMIPEYVDVVNCSDGQVYTSSLVLLGSDFGIVVVMPLAMMIHTSWIPYLNNNERSE